MAYYTNTFASQKLPDNIKDETLLINRHRLAYEAFLRVLVALENNTDMDDWECYLADEMFTEDNKRLSQ